MPDSLGKFKKLNVRTLWPNEATDFTPWLAQEENLTELSNALGIELEKERVEASVGPYSADILAKDPAGNYVVIENQLEKTDHDHLGKAITYASVLGATAIVWIAIDFTEEHHRALEWLNDHTTDDLEFYGVLVELWQIDDSRPAVRFNVISRPSSIKPSEAPGSREADLSDAQRLQLDFWTSFRQELLKKGVVNSARRASGQYWFDIPLGRSGINLSNTANTHEGRIGIRVYISNQIAEQALAQLLSQREAIEREMGEGLLWNPNPVARDKTIVLERELDLQNRELWPEGIEWMIERVARFRKVFMPRVKKLDLSKPSTSGPVEESS